MTTETKCCHHWLIDAEGAGVCKKCQATHTFAVFFEQVADKWNNSRLPKKPGRKPKGLNHLSKLEEIC